MTEQHRFNRAALAMDPAFRYLAEADRYLTARPEPAYRFNVIGAGINGQEHIRVTLLEGRATIHGVYDPNRRSVQAAQAEAARWQPGLELIAYDHLRDACHDPAVDGLIICTPNHTHFEIVQEAIRSGKHILLEKPMANTIRDAHAVWQFGQDYDAVLQIGLQYRFKPQYVEALYEIEQRRTIGLVKTIQVVKHRLPFMDKVDQWNKFARFSGNTLVEKCCHYFDLINLTAGGLPQTIYAVATDAVNFTDFEKDGARSDILDNGLVTLVYENGVTAAFNLCMFAPAYHEELIVCGSEGRLRATERRDFLPHQLPTAELEIATIDRRPSRTIQPMYPQIIQESGHLGATYIEHVEFINQIEGQASTAATAEEGFWSVVVAAAAQESIKSGRPLDLQTFWRSQLAA